MYLQVTAFSGHCKVRSVAEICLSDFQARFLEPTIDARLNGGRSAALLSIVNSIGFNYKQS